MHLLKMHLFVWHLQVRKVSAEIKTCVLQGLLTETSEISFHIFANLYIFFTINIPANARQYITKVYFRLNVNISKRQDPGVSLL